MVKKGPESIIQNAICEYLTFKNYVFWRNNTIPVWNREQKRYRAMPKYSKNGISDIIAFKDGKVWFLEVKTPQGRLSENQIIFMRECIENGIEYHTLKSVDDIINLGF